MSFRVGVSLLDYMKGVKDGTDIYERKADQAIGIIDGVANGNIHAGQFFI